jgi:glycosyltransferase involved in cell wall biosynthesis
MKISIIIPVFNEESTAAEVVETVRTLDFGPGLDKEIIVINDGSSDGTRAALERFEKVPGIVVHHNRVNLGKGSSVRLGFSYATGDLVTIQDADLELDPAEYKRLIVPIVEGRADVVYGSRFLEGGRRGSLPFYLANRSLAALTNVLYGSQLTDIETCYKVFRRDVLDRLKLRASRFEFEPEITAQLLRAGFRIVELPIGYEPRTHAQGKKIGWRDGMWAVYTLIDQKSRK